MFFIGPNHGIPRHHLCKFAPKNDKFHGISTKKTKFSDARKSWIKKILLHAKNQLSSSKNGHFRTNFIFRQNLDFSMGVPATVPCPWICVSALKTIVNQCQYDWGAEGAFVPPNPTPTLLFREIILKGILLSLHFLANSNKDTKNVNFANDIEK